jgi:hypothetical protein
MGWATNHIALLQQGETVSFRPRGNSMRGKIESGQLCTVEPVDPDAIQLGDIVLCKVQRFQYLHLVTAINAKEPKFGISNNQGHFNGWTNSKHVYGRLIKVE